MTNLEEGKGQEIRLAILDKLQHIISLVAREGFHMEGHRGFVLVEPDKDGRFSATFCVPAVDDFQHLPDVVEMFECYDPEVQTVVGLTIERPSIGSDGKLEPRNYYFFLRNIGPPTLSILN